MEKKDHLKFMLNINKSATESLLRDISEEDSLHLVDGYNNHIRWELGHMTGSMGFVLKCLSDEYPITEKWRTMFGRGAEFNEDSSQYPSLDEIKNKLDKIYEKIFEAVKKIDDAKLDEEITISPEWTETRMNAILFFSMHDFYHGGQVAIIRRTLGKHRIFG